MVWKRPWVKNLEQVEKVKVVEVPVGGVVGFWGEGEGPRPPHPPTPQPGQEHELPLERKTILSGHWKTLIMCIIAGHHQHYYYHILARYCLIILYISKIYQTFPITHSMCKEYKAYTVTPRTHRPSLHIQQSTSLFGPIVKFRTMITFLPVQTSKKRTEEPTPKKTLGWDCSETGGHNSQSYRHSTDRREISPNLEQKEGTLH